MLHLNPLLIRAFHAATPLMLQMPAVHAVALTIPLANNASMDHTALITTDSCYLTLAGHASGPHGAPQVQAQEGAQRGRLPACASHALTPSRSDSEGAAGLESASLHLQLEESQGLHHSPGQAPGC